VAKKAEDDVDKNPSVDIDEVTTLEPVPITYNECHEYLELHGSGFRDDKKKPQTTA
jgi:hypothetical protein